MQADVHNERVSKGYRSKFKHKLLAGQTIFSQSQINICLRNRPRATAAIDVLCKIMQDNTVNCMHCVLCYSLRPAVSFIHSSIHFFHSIVHNIQLNEDCMQ